MNCCTMQSNGGEAPSSGPSVDDPEVLIDDTYSDLPTSDFRALGNVDVVINGRTWRIVNAANNTTFGIIASTGLRYQGDNVSRDWIPATRTASGISIPFANIAGFNVAGTYIAEFSLSSSTQANGDRVVVSAFVDSTGTDLIVGAGKRTTASGTGGYLQTGSSIVGQAFSPGASTDNAFAMQLLPLGANGLSGVYANDAFPSRYPRVTGTAAQAVSSGPSALLPQDPGWNVPGAGLVIAFPNVNATGLAHVEVLERFRLLRVA